MSFSQRLAELVKRYHHGAEDQHPNGCECVTGWSELGAWVFTCRRCFEDGISQLESGPPDEPQQDLFALAEYYDAIARNELHH